MNCTDRPDWQRRRQKCVDEMEFLEDIWLIVGVSRLVKFLT